MTLRNVILLAPLAALLFFAPATQAKTKEHVTVMEMCNDTSGKLMVMYRLETGAQAYLKTAPNPFEDSKFIVESAFGADRESLEKQLKGYFDWAMQVVIEGFNEGQTPEKLRLSVLTKCLSRWGN